MINWAKYVNNFKNELILDPDRLFFKVVKELRVPEDEITDIEFIKCKVEVLKHNSSILRRSQKMVEDLKKKISQLDEKITIQEVETTKGERVKKVEAIQDKEIDVSCYVTLLLEEINEMYDEILPDEHEIDYELKLKSIIIEIYKEIKSAIDLSKECDEEEKKELLEYVEKAKKVIAHINKKMNKETATKEQEEKPNIIFLTKNKIDGNAAYVVSDLEDYVDSENWMDYKKLVDDFISGTFLNNIGNTEKNRSFNSNNQKLKGLCEAKNDQARIIYYHLGNNNYILIKAFSKKDDRSALVTIRLLTAMDQFKEQEEEIMENLSNPEFLVEQQTYFDQIDKIFAKRLGGKNVLL